MSHIFRRNPNVSGLIAHLGLAEWWEGELNANERDTILVRYQPLGGDSASLIEGEVLSTSQSPLHLLWGLATWFKKPEDWVLGQKIFNAGTRLLPSSSPLDAHFFHQARIEFFYRLRDQQPVSLQLAEQACRDQIAIAPVAAKVLAAQQDGQLPSHKGYWQLAVLLEKQGRLQEAIQTCEAAHAGGWSGDWQSRVEKLSKKLHKKQAHA